MDSPRGRSPWRPGGELFPRRPSLRMQNSSLETRITTSESWKIRQFNSLRKNSYKNSLFLLLWRTYLHGCLWLCWLLASLQRERLYSMSIVVCFPPIMYHRSHFLATLKHTANELISIISILSIVMMIAHQFCCLHNHRKHNKIFTVRSLEQ